MEKLKLVMRFYANCYARATCVARVSSKRGQLRCEGPADECLTTQFQLRSRNKIYDFPIT